MARNKPAKFRFEIAQFEYLCWKHAHQNQADVSPTDKVLIEMIKSIDSSELYHSKEFRAKYKSRSKQVKNEIHKHSKVVSKSV